MFNSYLPTYQCSLSFYFVLCTCTCTLRFSQTEILSWKGTVFSILIEFLVSPGVKFPYEITMDPRSRHPIVLQLGDVFPNFTAETTEGEISFHKWIGDSWAILFSHPADFTPVCTTELAEVARLSGEFKKRNVKPIALSCDDLASHREWIKDIKSYASIKEKEFPYPIIADNKRELADCLGMIDPEEKDAKGMPLTCRAVFIIGPDKRLKLSILYPATTGRNFDEILRVIDSLQLTYKKKVATPVNWKNGDKVMVLPNIPDIELPDLFPDGVTVTEVPSGRKYIRMTTQPQVDSDS